MKVYVSSHSYLLGAAVALQLREAGHEVVSAWHEQGEARPSSTDGAAWRAKADDNLTRIDECEALVLVSGHDRYPGGKFFEAGYARARGKRIIVLGHRENGMLWATGVEGVESIHDIR